ncbi:dye decolorizing peroxidase [Diaminobutyricimonas aerilata]|uniref:Dye decolorizing peroxidase n=1 Tax=Diaminobutyricimonas aerilata TaxID=1162967 RepID=A0A2M9CMT6_9MICO|nr:Dyp-type peroxidase [Diaminobutyricimonas aerilata]PJJ73226.1 dye decolorizing peroxidase [Diaminobutyricimonas aerilata]
MRRRSVLLGLGGLVTGAVAGGVGWGAATGWATAPVTGGKPSTEDPKLPRVEAAGRQQAGIRRPDTPQSHGRLLALDLPSTDLGWLAALGDLILDIVDGSHPDAATILPDGAGDLSITVGLGPRVIASVDPALPGAEELPDFKNDGAIPDSRRGGDVLLAAYCSDPTALRPVLDLVAAAVPGATKRWDQRGFRAPSEGTIVRNPLGFLDGVVVPRGDAEFDENVWIPDGPLAQGTVCVIRRLRLDVNAFHARSRGEQEAVFGRRAGDGAPLSGGGPRDQVDLRAKTPEGEYLVPANAHARAAHPSFTGSELMLRRGYTFDDGDVDGVADTGLLFVCFQRSLRTFTATQQRLDEVDALSQFVTPTGSATFVILPGFDRDRPLGAALVALHG